MIKILLLLMMMIIIIIGYLSHSAVKLGRKGTFITVKHYKDVNILVSNF